MKGMLDFLEKAGLVKNDTPATPPESEAAKPLSAARGQEPTELPLTPTLPNGQGLDVEAVYAKNGIASSIYPAERLLRLLDGLAAMDEATRLIAIKAMDAADESWSIQDPLTDAAAKIAALAAHADQLRRNLQIMQEQTQSRMDAIAARANQVVGDIRKQVSELEALAAREQARAAQESAAQQDNMKAASDQTARELSDVGTLSVRLQGLAAQFQSDSNPSAKD